MPAVETVTLDLDVSPIKATDGNGDRYIYDNNAKNYKSDIKMKRLFVFYDIFILCQNCHLFFTYVSFYHFSKVNTMNRSVY